MRVVVGQGSCGIAAGAGKVYNALALKMYTKVVFYPSAPALEKVHNLRELIDLYYRKGQFYSKNTDSFKSRCFFLLISQIGITTLPKNKGEKKCVLPYFNLTFPKTPEHFCA